MLRTTVIRQSQLALHLRLAAAGSANVQRHFSTTLKRKSPALSKVTTRGTEGLHRHDSPVSPKPPGTGGEALTTPDAVSTVPPSSSSGELFKGDWVLFHPVYSEEEVRAVEVLRRDAVTIGDKAAALFVALLRRGFDLVSGYKHKPFPPNYKEMTVQELRKGGYLMDDQQWLMRILFLESIAGVPGFVAATLRHLRSMRLMKRDSGWIHTLLQEAENERMHLMTFMTLKKPSIFLRALILGAQGVFYNLFFAAYIISPQMAHRFVGNIEEEAVLTYTRAIEELEAGRIPEWTSVPAPAIAKDYWRLSDSATLLDVLYAVRSDESTHRFVNHSLANLNYKEDVNPFALREPSMMVKGTKTGFTREESEEFVKESHEILEGKPREKKDN